MLWGCYVGGAGEGGWGAGAGDGWDGGGACLQGVWGGEGVGGGAWDCWGWEWGGMSIDGGKLVVKGVVGRMGFDLD